MKDLHGVQGRERAGRQDALAVRIIGALEVRRGGEMLGMKELGGPKCRQILEILLLQLGRPVSKARLVELLWGERPPAAAVSTLESYVSVLRRSLQPGMGAAGPLKTTTGGYFLDRAGVDLDLDRFDAFLRTAEQAEPARAHALLREALQLATAPLLGNEFLQGWAESERSFHEARVAGARLRAAETALTLGDTDDAGRWAKAVLASEPLNEAAWTVLVLSLERAGHPVEGLRAYEDCRRVLDTELGCAPGPSLREAQQRLLGATADGAGEFGEVLAALLTIQERIGNGAADTASGPDRNPAWDGCEEASGIVRRYLRRAMAAA